MVDASSSKPIGVVPLAGGGSGDELAAMFVVETDGDRPMAVMSK